MDDKQIGLIQRAAAKLKQSQTVTVPGRLPSASLNAPAAQEIQPQPPLARPSAPPRRAPPRASDIVIDKGRLTAAGIVLPSDERSRLAEEFRVIKQQVLAIARRPESEGKPGRSTRLIMVTSARPLEGKTFVSANLAFAIASEHDYRVLAIDADSARQSLGALLGVHANKGLGDFLAGEVTDFSEILVHTDLPNLTVLPFGHRYANTPELMSSNRMRTLLEEVASRYPDRFIVLDAPPSLATSEPSILAPLVGQIVVVVEANRTQRQEIEETLRLVSSCPNISLVLNKTDGKSPDEFGSYGYYH